MSSFVAGKLDTFSLLWVIVRAEARTYLRNKYGDKSRSRFPSGMTNKKPGTTGTNQQRNSSNRRIQQCLLSGCNGLTSPPVEPAALGLGSINAGLGHAGVENGSDQKRRPEHILILLI